MDVHIDHIMDNKMRMATLARQELVRTVKGDRPGLSHEQELRHIPKHELTKLVHELQHEEASTQHV